MQTVKIYRVEQIAGQVVVARQVAEAETPWEAATKITGKVVRGRRDERFWVRVTDQATLTTFKYAYN
ncbi:hypothetical protein LCM4577_31415 [Mesorhizobium sp. LCM 4577]|uniref:Uncharacterized protein n=1 Tax=Mesorhizobium plurifarium TaxID=69974 RepID=A0A090DB26_MESPL|nr:hypothetical protein LCM4577_31415 [Mesorhizobium sp. LCM 4577]CDX12487.1 conserved hypothetical protein [Mesorhizobium plurifarium]